MRRAPEPTTLRNYRFTRADDRALAKVRDAHPEMGNDTAVIRYLIHKEAGQITGSSPATASYAARAHLQKGGKR